jgi:hypothetical protein
LVTKTSNTYGIAEKNKKYLEDYISNKVKKSLSGPKEIVEVKK